MIRVFIYLLVLGCFLYFLWFWGRKNQGAETGAGSSQLKHRTRFRGKNNPMNIWVQVYETATSQEGRMIQARLQEEEVECILYEQGKKDIHGNELPGIGIAVPKSALARAQNVISRMPL